MKRTTRRRIERIVLVLSALSSLITVLTFATGVTSFTDLVTIAKDYLASVLEVAPPIIRWPIKAVAWLLWFFLVLIYRSIIAIGLPLVPALAIAAIVDVNMPPEKYGSDTPLHVGLVVYFMAMLVLIVALNSSPEFSRRIGMGG